MPTVPLFFRHYISKMRTALESGNQKKFAQLSAPSQQSDHIQSPKVAYAKIPYDYTDNFVELNEGDSQFEPSGPSNKVFTVCSREIAGNDEEQIYYPSLADRH